MKLVVAGSTGFVATEVIRQALNLPAITSVVALARRETATPPAPENATADYRPSKLTSLVCEDFGAYSDEAKQKLAGADACIWLLAVTPSKSKTMPFAQVRKICHDFTVTGLETMAPLSKAKPFRFIYTSGVNAERDQTKKPWILGEYALMRGQVESTVLQYAHESNGKVEACVTKPGIIEAPGRMTMARSLFMAVVRTVVGLPQVQVSQIAAALIEQAVKGVEKDTLLNEDLVEIGDRVLGERGVVADAKD